MVLTSRTKSAQPPPSILGGADERNHQQDHHDENQRGPERRAVGVMMEIAAESVGEHGSLGFGAIIPMGRKITSMERRPD
jgi:hypothetical protein